jgi:hypothetical protein
VVIVVVEIIGVQVVLFTVAAFDEKVGHYSQNKANYHNCNYRQNVLLTF